MGTRGTTHGAYRGGPVGACLLYTVHGTATSVLGTWSATSAPPQHRGGGARTCSPGLKAFCGQWGLYHPPGSRNRVKHTIFWHLKPASGPNRVAKSPFYGKIADFAIKSAILTVLAKFTLSRLEIWPFWPEMSEKTTKKWSQDLVILARFGPFSDNLWVHDFWVSFQSGPNSHIYRGPGKSEIRMVFWSVPYGSDPEIGGLDGVFVPEFSVLQGDVSPWGAKKVSFFAIFGDFLQKVSKY